MRAARAATREPPSDDGFRWSYSTTPDARWRVESQNNLKNENAILRLPGIWCLRYTCCHETVIRSSNNDWECRSQFPSRYRYWPPHCYRVKLSLVRMPFWKNHICNWVMSPGYPRASC